MGVWLGTNTIHNTTHISLHNNTIHTLPWDVTLWFYQPVVSAFSGRPEDTPADTPRELSLGIAVEGVGTGGGNSSAVMPGG